MVICALEAYSNVRDIVTYVHLGQAVSVHGTVSILKCIKLFFHLIEYPQNWEIWLLSLGSIQSSRSILSVAVHSKMTKAVDANGLVVWRCEECGHESRRSGDLSKHIEAKHLRCAGFNCEFCGKFCPSKNALTSHVSRNHRSSSIMWFYLGVRSNSKLCCNILWHDQNQNINAWFFRGGRLPEREYAEKQQWFLGMFILWLFFETKAPCEESHRIKTYQSPVLMSILFQNLSILSCSRNAYSS